MTKQTTHFIALLIFSLLFFACSEQPAPPAPTQSQATTSTPQQNASADNTKPASDYRIVTLAPTLTEMVCYLGFTDNIVGVGAYDTILPQERNIPVLGIYTAIDTERLLSLEPTHVFMLPGKNGPPSDLTALAEAGAFKLFAYNYPDTIDATLQILDSDGTSLAKLNPPNNIFAGDNIPGLGQALDRVELSTQLKTAILTRLHKIMQLTKNQPKIKTLMLFSLKEPIMASGPDTVNDQLLNIAGGINATGTSAVQAPTFDRESLVAIAPEVILALLPDQPAQQPNDQRLANLASLPIPAAKNNRIFVLNSPTILIPSINLYQTAASFAIYLHPSLEEQLTPILKTPITEPLPEDATELQSAN